MKCQALAEKVVVATTNEAFLKPKGKFEQKT